MIRKRQEKCPKCKHKLPEDTGEWSDTSSLEMPLTEKNEPETQPVETVLPENSNEKITDENGDKKTDDEIKTPGSVSGPGPLFKKEVPESEDKGEPSDKRGDNFRTKIEKRTYQEKKKTEGGGEKTYIEETLPDKDGKKYTVPESYMKDSATFSTELSTDWIERYARSHVSPLPERAGMGVRFWAGTLDWILLIAVGVLALLVGKLLISFMSGSQFSPSQLLKILSWPIGGFWFVMLVLYFTTFIYATGQTPGCMLMDIRVYDADTNHPPSLGKSFIRAMVYIGGLVLGGIGSWVALFDPARRTWQDRLSGTRVMPLIKI